ncbi:MAG: nodulation protein NfeD [Deltaproteobacteria bacterium]|nr:nodulation protein NfeD [Deltaproteobacteria bacterium]
MLIRLNYIVILFLIGLSSFSSNLWSQTQNKVFLLKIDGIIGPATSDYFESSVNKAHEAKAHAIILQMDTPGGLDTSMRAIIKVILASKIPIISYVAPEGSRAASAGTYILYASHLAAMAPATNLGAATPVNLLGSSKPKDEEDKKTDDKDKKVSGTAIEKKAIHDANAYLRSLAKLRGRNEEWVSHAVTQGESLTAEEALNKNVINLMAEDIKELLQKIDGHKISISKQDYTLKTNQAKIIRLSPNWQNKLLSFIANPSIAYLLILIGFYGLIYEFSTPGSIGPGVAGAIFILVGFYGLHILPVNYFGIALIVLGLGMMIAEAFVPSFGALGAGGIIAFVMGSFVLIDADKFPDLKIPRILIFSLAGMSALFIFIVSSMAIRSKRRQIVSGSEELLGSRGEAYEDFEEYGNIWIHGELWRAHSSIPVKRSQIIRVTARHGLELEIEPIEKEPNLKED